MPTDNPPIHEGADGIGGPTFNPDTHFAQPKITGYRQLSTNEVKLMNAIKAQGEQLQSLVDTLRGTPNLDQRWISIGVTDLQKGLMSLTRGVAQPTSF
jgi:hypothetical protein